MHRAARQRVLGGEHHQLGGQDRAGHACACELGFVFDDEPWNIEVPFSQPMPISKDACVFVSVRPSLLLKL